MYLNFFFKLESRIVPPTHGMHRGLRLGADESVAGNVAVQLVGRRHHIGLLHTVCIDV